MKKENIDYMGLNAPMVVVLLLITSFVMLSMFAGVGHAYVWYDTTALVRNNLTVENMGTTTLNNFPFLINKNFTSFAGSCTDFNVVNSTNTELIKYRTENNTCLLGGNATVWASAPSLVNNANSTAGVLYHNFTPAPSDTSTNPFDTTVYKRVYHMGELAGKFFDDINASSTQTLTEVSYGFSGYFGYGLRTNGSATTGVGIGITNGTSNLNDTLLTVEIWFNASDHVSRTLFGWTSGSCELAINPNQGSGGTIRTYSGNPTGTLFDNIGTAGGVTYNANEWNYFVFKYDGARSYAYKNGVLIQNLQVSNSNRSLCITPTNSLFIGSGGSGGLKGFNGTIDEVRVSSANLSDAYISSVWANRNGAIIGDTELYVLQPPVISIFDPANTTYTKLTGLYLNVSTNQEPTTLVYSLNGGANITLIPNTTFTGVIGSNNIIVTATNINGTSTARIFFTVNTPPTISIVNPIATIYTDANVTLKINFNDNDPDKFWYILNLNPNVSFIPNTTITAGVGLNSIRVYMNDTYGSMASSSTVNFTLNTSYIPPTTPTTSTTDPNVLLFLVVLILSVVGLFWLMK